MIYENYPELKSISADINRAIDMIADSYKNGGKLMKGFKKKRPVTDERIPAELAAKLQGALPAVSLSGGLALPTAYLNDVDGEYIVAQTLYGLARPGDTALLVSTSGNAKNLCHAASLAKCIGVKTIALTGKTGGKLAEICDHVIKVPSTETYRVQEYHLPVYHEICARIEDIFYNV